MLQCNAWRALVVAIIQSKNTQRQINRVTSDDGGGAKADTNTPTTPQTSDKANTETTGKRWTDVERKLEIASSQTKPSFPSDRITLEMTAGQEGSFSFSYQVPGHAKTKPAN